MIKCAYAILSPVAARLYNIFPHYLIKGMNLKKKKNIYIKYVSSFSLQILSETFLILRGNKIEIIIMYIRLRVTYRLFLSHVKEIWIFWQIFEKYSQTCFHEIRPVAAKLFHSDRRTDIQSVPGGMCQTSGECSLYITQNTYIQSWTVTEIMAREVWNFDSCYTLIDYQIHIKPGRNMLFL
jgi:hypothetical protein